MTCHTLQLWTWLKDTTHKRPNSLTYLGKTRASRQTKKVRAKIRDKYNKFIHSTSRKPEKMAWARKGIPVDRKSERAVQAKVRDLKRTTMSRHLITCLSVEELSPRSTFNQTSGVRIILKPSTKPSQILSLVGTRGKGILLKGHCHILNLQPCDVRCSCIPGRARISNH